MTRRPHSTYHDVLVALIAATALVWALLIAMWLTDNTKSPVPTPPDGAPDAADRLGSAASVSRGTARTSPPTPSAEPTRSVERAGQASGGGVRATIPAPPPSPEGEAGGGGGWPWGDLAQCESSGNPTALSPGGTYRGLFQFSIPTWLSVGGTGDPAQASVAEQLHRAKILQARSGWGQWPQCAAQLGLIP